MLIPYVNIRASLLSLAMLIVGWPRVLPLGSVRAQDLYGQTRIGVQVGLSEDIQDGSFFVDNGSVTSPAWREVPRGSGIGYSFGFLVERFLTRFFAMAGQITVSHVAISSPTVDGIGQAFLVDQSLNDLAAELRVRCLPWQKGFFVAGGAAFGLLLGSDVRAQGYDYGGIRGLGDAQVSLLIGAGYDFQVADFTLAPSATYAFPQIPIGNDSINSNFRIPALSLSLTLEFPF